MFRSKRALLSLTTGSPQEAYTPDGLNGDLDAILRAIERGILEFTDFSVLRPEMHIQPVGVQAAERQAWLEAWSDRLLGIEQESPIVVGRYRCVCLFDSGAFARTREGAKNANRSVALAGAGGSVTTRFFAEVAHGLS